MCGAQIDIRATSSLSDSNEQSSYSAVFSDCSSIAYIEAGSVNLRHAFSSNEVSAWSDSSGRCQISFTLSGAEKYSPSVKIVRLDETETVHNEQFSNESNAPKIDVVGASISVDKDQYLTVTFNASDDTDLSRLEVNAIGLRASDIRQAGGVINEARKRSFAKTEETTSLIPISNDQSLFTLTIPVNGSLSNAAIASDVVVLVDVVAIDASGNQTALSELVTTGDNIQEDVLSLSLESALVQITDPLQTVALNPIVTFEFRGPISMAGLGRAIKYESSSPELVAVTPAGVVYPLAETSDHPVTITVTYPGLPPEQVTVDVDYDKTLERLSYQGGENKQPWVLPSLNQPYTLPNIMGHYSDGSVVTIPESWKIALEIPEAYKALLKLKSANSLQANSPIVEDYPAIVTFYLEAIPNAKGLLYVASADAFPEVSIISPKQLLVPSTLELSAIASDDVAIQKVEFLVDGVVMGELLEPPYKMSFPLDANFAGRSIDVTAIATDSAGQRSSTNVSAIELVNAPEAVAPQFEFENPIDGTVWVESTQIKATISSLLGTLPDLSKQNSGITKAELYLDGELVGEANFPSVEQRKNLDDEDEIFETWSVNYQLPTISTNERNISVYMNVYGSNNAVFRTNSRLIRVVKNDRPSIVISSPTAGSSVTAGQTIPILLTVEDDTLLAGTEVALLVNGVEFESKVLVDNNQHIGKKSLTEQVQFDYFIDPELIYTNLDLQAKVTDYHQEQVQSTVVSVPVKQDFAPSVAITSPTEGYVATAGLPVQVRADAVDDIGVEKVEFYVDGRLIGSDKTRPYATVYDTPENISSAQSLRLSAVAYDTKGQTNNSAAVNITLGFDEEAPVINLASPQINTLKLGQNYAELIENSEFVIKVTGYDNVGVDRLELAGVYKEGNDFYLSGSLDTKIASDDFSPQDIPGALTAFSALKMARAPEFIGSSANDFDSYPISITAWDKAGNSSVVTAWLAVLEDQAPTIVEMVSDKELYRPTDLISLSVLAKDDRAVVGAELEYWQDNKRIAVRRFDQVSGLTPGPELLISDQLNMADFDLDNKAKPILVKAIAWDLLGQVSATTSLELSVLADETGPNIALISPKAGVALVNHQDHTLTLNVKDSAGLASITVSVNGEVNKYTIENSEPDYTLTQTLSVLDQQSVELRVEAVDNFGNQNVVDWVFDTLENEAPVISLRQPASGLSVTEGEALNIAALVSDDLGLAQVDFIVTQNGKESIFEQFYGEKLKEVVASGGYFTAFTRIPKLEQDTQISIRAIDVHEASSTLVLELRYNQDVVDPSISLIQPLSDLSLLPDQAFNVVGTAADDRYIAAIDAVLLDSDGVDTGVGWESLARKDRVEQVTVDNDNSFGSTVIAEHFYSDFTARVRLPINISEFGDGKHFKFAVQAFDQGGNQIVSRLIDLVIKDDEVAPTIRILTPLTSIVEGQELDFRAELQDNVAISSYKVTLVADKIVELMAADQLNQASITLSASSVYDLSALGVVPYEGMSVDLKIEVTDTSGNVEKVTHNVAIKPDLAPVVTLIEQLPSRNWQDGDLVRTRFSIDDDYLDEEIPSYFSSFWSNLSADNMIDPRLFSSEVELVDQDPNWAVTTSYPEQALSPATLELDDKRFVAFKDQKILVSPAQFRASSSLRLIVENATVSYKLSYSEASICQVEPSSFVVEADQLIDDNGKLIFTKWIPKNTPYVEIKPIIDGVEDSFYVRQIRIDFLGKSGPYVVGEQAHSASGSTQLQLVVKDNSSANGTALLLFNSAEKLTQLNQSVVRTWLIPFISSARRLSLFAFATDWRSHLREAVTPNAIISTNLNVDQQAPEVNIQAPSVESEVIDGEFLSVRLNASDNAGIKSLSLLDNKGLYSKVASWPQTKSFEFQYKVQDILPGSALNLTAIVEDHSGKLSSQEINLPIIENNAPLLKLKKLSSYKVDGKFQKNIIDPAVLEYAEFWLRTGEDFALEFDVSDDTELHHLGLYRVTRDGSLVEEYLEEFEFTCPAYPTRSVLNKHVEIAFLQTEPTEYVLRAIDGSQHVSERRFIVHPLANIAPEIRIVSPAADQYIVNGTVQISVGIVATDDRLLGKSQIQVFANGELLQTIESENGANASDAQINQAIEEMYDEYERKYSVSIAEQFAKKNSPNLTTKRFLLKVPATVYQRNDQIELTATVTDSDDALGKHSISVIAAVDEINPEIAVISPELGFAATEHSDFSFRWRAFDNVKVSSMSVEVGYGLWEEGLAYRKQDAFETVRRVSSIPSVDSDPSTTSSFDTPIYSQLLHVERLSEIVNRFDNVSDISTARFDYWVKVNAVDASGNTNSTEFSLPIKIDERPVVDIQRPIDGTNQVAGSFLDIQVNAYDDVGIDSVVAVVRRGSEVLLDFRNRKPPYNFGLNLPEFDHSNPENNILFIEIEALDTYGAKYGDLDKHIAKEQVAIQLVEDMPPTVVIASPTNNSIMTEGENLLIQVNAIDDVAVDRVSLTVAGLMSGDKTFISTAAPYDFYLNIPFGQAGRDLQLTAGVTELRTLSDPRTVHTANTTKVIVEKDTLAPELSINYPVVGGTVAEGKQLPFSFVVKDNVKVANVKVELLADGDLNGMFDSNSELVSSQVLLAAPWSGQLAVAKLSDYVAEQSTSLTSLPLLVKVTANDGAGNKTVVSRSVQLVKNQAPVVNDISFLNSLGHVIAIDGATVTEGRDLVVSVTASDLESGINRVSLYQAVDFDTLANANFQKIGSDGLAPYQFDIAVPQGMAGRKIAFRAIAEDLDGNSSEPSLAAQLNIQVDQPPTATIIQPSNDLASVIQGQVMSVVAEVGDDLGVEGIDRVDFYINGSLVDSVFESISTRSGGIGQFGQYQLEILPPEGAQGFALQAVAYDRLNQPGRSQVVHVGILEDTVKPLLEVLNPVDNDILTQAETLTIAVAVTDIGVAENRSVLATLIREHQTADGRWVELASKNTQLYRIDHGVRPDIELSEPNSHRYIYWTQLADGKVLARQRNRNERVRIVAKVVTPNHETVAETTHEVGLGLTNQTYFMPSPGTEDAAKSVYYNAIQQFSSNERRGAVVGSWSTVDPLVVEQGISFVANELANDPCGACSGLFLTEFVAEDNELGERFVYSQLLNGASEYFEGIISEIHTDANFVLASKHGIAISKKSQPGSSFTSSLQEEIDLNPETGAKYYGGQDGELLVFSIRNGDGQFGLPYLLEGRYTLPYSQVFGLDRKDGLAFVANGYGGVQVIDLKQLSAPRRVGFIKPDGFARDVKISGDYAFIAASHQGVVIADVADPAMPIVASIDTLGVANRIEVVGDRVFVAEMAGDGQVSQFSVINVRDPHNPKFVQSVSIKAERQDFRASGSYDIAVVGNQAYLTTQYLNQEDKPSQTVLQVFDLDSLNQAGVDASIPALLNHKAAELGYVARDLTLAGGAIQVASGKQGIARVELAELTVVGTLPGRNEQHVSTAIPSFIIDFSAPLGLDQNVVDFVQVFEGSVLIDSQGNYQLGEDISEQFSVSFVDRAVDSHTALQVTPHQELQAGVTYTVVVKSGLSPLTGYALANDYVWEFNTSVAGDLPFPIVKSIKPSSGTVKGGEDVIIEVTHLGKEPRVTFGHQTAQISSIDSTDGVSRLHIVTPPNYAGPAAVNVSNSAGLSASIIGGFTYLDVLQINAVTPGVVNVKQVGAGERVTLTGYGFNESLGLKVYQHGSSELLYQSLVNNDSLILHSGERLEWVVPNIDLPTRSYVDLVLVDSITNQVAHKSKALFFGGLSVNRTLQTRERASISQILKDIDRAAKGLPPLIAPDVTKLPPGRIIGLESDSELGLVYVLGVPIPFVDGPHHNNLVNTNEFNQLVSPAWLSLVHYDLDELENAAPMHGLGYYDLPKDVWPRTMVLSDTQLYVSANGFDIPLINTPYKSRNWILVYDRETRLPEELGQGSKNRDILFALPIPSANAPTKMQVVDKLLIGQVDNSEITLFSLADPVRPSLLQRITTASIGGVVRPLNIQDFAIVGEKLLVNSSFGGKSYLVDYDLSRPSAPQVAVRLLDGENSLKVSSQGDNNRLAVAGSGVGIVGLQSNNSLNHLGHYQDNGFPLKTHLDGMSSTYTSVSQLRSNGKTLRSYEFDLLDTSRVDNVSVLDALHLASDLNTCRVEGNYSGVNDLPNAVEHLTNDGVALAAYVEETQTGEGSCNLGYISRLQFTDTYVSDIVKHSPEQNATHVAVDSTIVIDFNHGLSIPANQDAGAYLARYLHLSKDDGSTNGLELTFDAQLDPLLSTRLLIKPIEDFDADSTYKVVIESELGSRRSAGLVNYELRFATANVYGDAPRIVEVEQAVIATAGGQFVLKAMFANDPIVRIGEEIAGVELLNTDGLVSSYTITAPPHAAGVASLEVEVADGRKDKWLGAVRYVEPLNLNTISPTIGSVNGGTSVVLSGSGFVSAGDTRVWIGGVEVDNLKVLSPELIELVTPPGQLGSSDVVIVNTDQQTVTLAAAFEYQQANNMRIETGKDGQQAARIYQMVMDPSNTYVIAAAGRDGVLITNIDASTYISDVDDIANPDELLQRIDKNQDLLDDRVVGRIALPTGYRALGVTASFSRNSKRIYVSAV
ncbi:Ig-like domain-containing protein [Agarivorans albus]|nr:Ig-like domain-containing protein [Agarivorans albus]